MSRAGRIFHRGVISVYAQKRGKHITFSLCSARFKTPQQFHQRRFETNGELPESDVFKVRGQRLYYEDYVVAIGRELLAWVDLRTAQYREVYIPKDVEYDEISAIAADGSILFVTIDDKGHRIWVADAGATALKRPRIAVRVTNGDMDPGSLTARRNVIRWTTPYGTPRQAALTRTARAVTVSSAPITCNAKQQVYNNAMTRIFFRMIGHVEHFYVCSAAISKPKIFLYKTPYGSPELYNFAQAGSTLTFTIDSECDFCEPGAAALDLRTGKLTRAPPRTPLATGAAHHARPRHRGLID